MQELEKILEEIENLQDIPGWDLQTIQGILEIIRKHMSGKGINVPTNDGWIPVERELPPNARHEGALCPKYQVMTKYGVTEGWYNPNVKGWYVLFWFMTESLDSEVDFDRGDVLRVVFLSDEANNEANILTAWQPLPEPYRGKEQG